MYMKMFGFFYMRPLYVALIFIFSNFVSCNSSQRSQTFLGRSTQLFTVDLFSRLEKTNQLFSPILIQSGLSILPARGQAKTELLKTLHLSSINFWTNAYRGFLHSVINSKDFEINAGSSMYLTEDISYPKAYKKLLQMYGTSLESADFSKPEIVAKEINQWVERKTNNKIHDIIDPSTLDPNTEALLVTALYFNGNWEKPFEKETTHPGKFYLDEKQEMTTNMMMQSSKFNYAENVGLGAKFLELPYKNQDYVMTLVLPDQKNGLSSLEQKIDRIFAAQNYSLQETILNMPKFNFKNKVELTGILRKLGLSAIFEDGLSFGNSKSKKVKVDNIIQKTFIEVNEVGTEAAAVMEVEMSARFGMPELKSFNADHPFLFFIQQKSSGIILFFGRFTKPE